MSFLSISIVLLFVAISLSFLLVDKHMQTPVRYETWNIKGTARGHLGMFCPKCVVESIRELLDQTNTKF